MRVALSEISFNRLAEAAARRVAAVPTAVSWMASREATDARRYLAGFQGIHVGERCYVLANGPSLNAVPVEVFRDATTFSMNRAYLMYDAWGFQPSYYVAINDLVLEQFAPDIRRLPMPKFVTYRHRRLFDNVPNVGLVHTRMSLVDRFRGTPLNGLSTGGTVTYVALQLAYFMGFHEVVLLGLDHRFSARGTPNKTETRIEDEDKDHMHPSYFPKGIKWQLPDLTRSEVAYARARAAFEADGRRIIDATIDGACTIFEKASIDSL